MYALPLIGALLLTFASCLDGQKEASSIPSFSRSLREAEPGFVRKNNQHKKMKESKRGNKRKLTKRNKKNSSKNTKKKK